MVIFICFKNSELSPLIFIPKKEQIEKNSGSVIFYAVCTKVLMLMNRIQQETKSNIDKQSIAKWVHLLSFPSGETANKFDNAKRQMKDAE